MVLFGTYIYDPPFMEGKRKIPATWFFDHESLRPKLAEAEEYRDQWWARDEEANPGQETVIVMLDCRIMDVKTNAPFDPQKQLDLFDHGEQQ